MELTESQTHAIDILVVVAAALSLCGSSFIIFCSWLLGRTGKYFQLVVWLSVSDVLWELLNFALVLVPPGSTAGCKAMGFFVMLFQLPPILYTTCISAHLFVTIFVRKVRTGKMFLIYGIYCYGTPLVLALVGNVADVYGDDGVLCWIAKRHLKWQIFLFYIPLWIAVLWNIVVGRLVTREFHRVFKLGTAGRAMVHVHRLNLYPLVLLGCWGVGSISSVVQWVAGGDCPFWVTALQYVLGNCQGLGNAIVYGFDPAMLEQLRARILGMPGDADPGAPKPQESAVHLDSSIAMAVPDEPPTVVMERLGLSDGRNPDPDATEASVSPGSVHSMHSDSEPTSPNVGKGVG